MTAHEIHALSGAYAVNALDDLERARFEDHLAACAECREEVASLQDATLYLSQLTEVAPPTSVRTHVLSEIRKVRPLPPVVARIEPRRPRRWANLVAAAAVLGVLGAGTMVVLDQVRDDSGQASLPSADRDIQAVLQAADVKHVSASMPRGASATVFRSSLRNAAVLVTREMPAAPSKHVYQLWLQKNGRMVPAGLITSGGNHTVLLKGTANDASGVGVTVEPEGGSTEPTTAPVALMDFEQAT